MLVATTKSGSRRLNKSKRIIYTSKRRKYSKDMSRGYEVRDIS